jgi:hypothetical protein
LVVVFFSSQSDRNDGTEAVSLSYQLEPPVSSKLARLADGSS